MIRSSAWGMAGRGRLDMRPQHTRVLPAETLATMCQQSISELASLFVPCKQIFRVSWNLPTKPGLSLLVWLFIHRGVKKSGCDRTVAYFRGGGSFCHFAKTLGRSWVATSILERRSGEVYRKHESCGTHGHSLHYVTGMCHREVEGRGTRGSEDLNERAKIK